MQADRQDRRQTDSKQADRQDRRQTDRQACRQTDRIEDSQTAGRQTDRIEGRQTSRQAGRQAYRDRIERQSATGRRYLGRRLQDDNGTGR